MEIKKSTIYTVLTVLVILILVGGVIMILPSSNKEDNQNGSDSTTVEQNLETVSVSDFNNAIGSEGSVLLDIRTAQEFDNGRIEGSVNLDFYSSSFKSDLDKLDKGTEYHIYCNSGNRSASALSIMKDLGFTNVLELDGGITAWNMNGNSICTDC